MLLALVIRPLTMHPEHRVTTPNRDCSNTWALIPFSIKYIEFSFLSYPLPVSPSVATIYLLGWQSFSRYFLVYQTSPCRTRLFSTSSPLTHPVPPCIFHILPQCEFYSTALPQGPICTSSSSFSRLLAYLFLSGRSRSPARNRSFSFFAYSIGPCKYVFIPISSLNPP